MRKVVRVLLVAAMLLPIGLVASPAGAAGGETCTRVAGPVFFSPPLPKIGSNTRVITTVTAKTAQVSGCTGPAGAIGAVSLTAKSKTKANCATLSAGAAITLTGTVTIKWKVGKPSTIAVVLVSPPKSKFTVNVTGKVSAGQFLGGLLSASVTYAPELGSCSANPLSKATIKLAKGARFVIS